MGIILHNAMKIGGLRDCTIVAGHEGVKREIDNVTIMEVPDIVRWLKGKELLITSLFAVQEEQDVQRELIRRLHESGTAAIAIKPFHFLKKIPEVVIEEADKLGFPVIEIPEHISYLDILSPLMNAIFDKKVVLQEDLEQASQILREISLGNKGMEGFIHTLESLTKNKITIESQLPFIQLPAPSGDFSTLTESARSELAYIKHPIRMTRMLDGQEIPCIVAPVLVDGQVYGIITSWGMNTENLEIDLAVLEKAATLIALDFLRLKVKYDVEQQYKNDFVRELLFNKSMNEKDLLEWGEKYHFSAKRENVCLLLTGNGKEHQAKGHLEKMNEVDHVVRRRWPQAIVGSIRDVVCVILPVSGSDENQIEKQCSILFNEFRDYVGSRIVARMGVGRKAAGIEGLRRSYFEAEQAVKLQARLKDPKPILFYGQMGIYRLLGQLTGKNELEDFYRETVAPLLEYDLHHDLALIETLKAYFQHNENLKETAEALFIHVNTLKYRLNKMEALTGHSLSETEGKAMLYLGLKIHEMIKE